MTKLKSFGCSFIFGSDLADAGTQASQHTWPALLAKDAGMSYQCFAKGGSGNLQILNSLLSQLDDPEPALFVIGWTWTDRFDFIGPLDRKWHTIRPATTDNESEFYYKNLHSQFCDKLTSLIYINTAINALSATKNKFIMTCQDNLIFETTWHFTKSIDSLQKSVKPYITQFENLSFLEWSRQKDFEISATWHPLEQAHCAAFEYIRDQCLV
jgi:hypothetical protein